LSNLQHWIFGGWQSQQSWRELPHALFDERPHTSPSGSQPVGFEQAPTGGLVPAAMLQVVSFAPGRPELGPPQQSVDLVHRSPIRRQPLAGVQVWAPVAVGAQVRLQQFPQPGQGSPSIMQPPEPVVMRTAQVPAVPPAGMVQTPEQQSEDWKHTSPSAEQPEPVVVHLPPWQFCEQQVAFAVQALPSVVQVPPPATGWQVPPMQLPEQQPVPLHAWPFWTQAVPQVPFTQFTVQQSVDTLQAAPVAAQTPAG
jgi:hypothetical protein